MADLGKVCITPKGEYVETKTYSYLDTLTYEGSSFMVKKTCTGVTPDKTEKDPYSVECYWCIAKGADGADIYQVEEPESQVAGAFWDQPYN